MTMPENEYLKLLANKIFWGAIMGAIIISASGTAMYYGLKSDLQGMNTKMEIRDIKVDNRLDGIDEKLDKKQDKLTMIK